MNVQCAPGLTSSKRGAVLSHEEFLRTPCFAGLDLLRGLSILLVLWHHVPTVSHEALLAPLQHNARHGVALFFAISGFLIASLLLREFRHAGRIDIWRFYARRAFRLFPLYYVMLVAHAVLVWVGFYAEENRLLFGEKLWSYLLYFSNWLPTSGEGPFFQAWSLAAEEQFYLLFALGLAIFRPALLLPITVGMLLLKIAVFFADPHVEQALPVARIILSYQEPILMGVLLAYALENRRLYGLFARHSRNLLPAAAILVSALLLLMPTATYVGWDAQLIYAAMTLLIGACVVRRHIQIPDRGMLPLVGKVSYGIYLLHMLVIAAVKKVPFMNDPYICFFVSAVVVIPIAVCVYEWFEAPLIRFAKRRFAPAVPASAAPVSGPLPVGLAVAVPHVAIAGAPAITPTLPHPPD